MFRRFAAFAFCDDFLFELARHFFVVAEFLGVNAASAGEGPDRGGIMVEFHRRHRRFDDLERTVGVHPQNLSPPTGEVADNLSQRVFGDLDFKVEDRFEQRGPGVRERCLERFLAGDLEGDVVGVHRVHFAVVKINFGIHNPIAGEHAFSAGGHST